MIMALAGVAGSNLSLLLWAAAMAAVAGGLGIWSRLAWLKVEVEATFEPSRAYRGEPVALRVRIVNGKRFPLPLVRLNVWLPPGLSPAPGSGSPTMRGWERRLSLPGRSEAVLDLPLRVRRRGEYWLERVIVELTDPFDLAPLRRELQPEAILLVIPQPKAAVPLHVRKRLPFGTPALAARMFEARERFAGVRPYEPGDPLNRIHWKLTGHAAGLQVKLFEPTRNADVLLLLDLATGEPFWDAIYPEFAEETIAWGAFLGREAIEAGWRVGMVANTHLSKGRGPLRVPPSSARGHEAALFMALSRMPNEPTSDMAPVLRELGRRMGRDTTAVVVSPKPGYWLAREMEVLQRRGAQVIHISPLERALA
jgi:uncharacterized protein (DUF58 family)